MPRAILIVMDSFGCGGATEAADFGDAGADTLGHIAQACAEGRGDRAGLRLGPLRLPNLARRGLALAAEASTGRWPAGFAREDVHASWGYGVETSKGKDTPSGHWEMAGSPVDFAWGYFPETIPCFPPGLVDAMVREGRLPGILGNRHASGINIIEELGEESLRTGKPICYTSVDSVFQIAAHEEAFGLDRLYDLCAIVRRLCDPLRIGRVIARPFTGSSQAGFRRTPHRRDFAVPPPAGNLLDRVHEGGRMMLSLGKLGDIFAHRNTGTEIKGDNNMDLFTHMLRALPGLAEGGLAFANFVDFDSEHGHRRDIPGYAACLEQFDARLPELDTLLRADDIVVISADHGNDPSWRGTDHTREHVPILCYGPQVTTRALGRRATFADIGASIAHHLGLEPTKTGASWW